MSIFDWLGPLNAGGKARGWHALPAIAAPASPVAETRGVDFVPANAAGSVVAVSALGYSAGPARGGVGAGDGNSAAFACLQAFATALAEPELKLYRTGAAERIEVENAELAKLLRAPNPHMTLDTLLWYLGVCLKVDGNAYWRKLRAGDPETGNVVALWPISPSRIEPTTAHGSDDFVTAYIYRVDGREELLPAANVVHFRHGLSDGDHRLGVAPLKRLLREISSDEQATRYADRLLANLAINGLSLEFDKDAPAITPAIADELKARISSAYGGDNVGSTAVLSPGAKLTALGFSPEQLDMKTLHRVPEERIAAVLGVPAIVAGLGAGLDRSTYANFKEAREAFTEMTLIPTWRAVAATITQALLPDFDSGAGLALDFDISEVRALADDENADAVRLKTLVDAGIMDKNEARAEIGLPPRAEPAPAPAPSMTSDAAAIVVPAAASRLRLLGRRAIERKAIEDLPRLYGDLRDEVIDDWVSEVASYLAAQRRRALRLVRDGADTAEAIIPDIEVSRLAETLAPLQSAELAAVFDLCVAELGVGFDIDDAATREYLRRCGRSIVGITRTTRDAVRAELLDGQAAGESIPQLAARIRGLPAFGSARATVVARTELGASQNEAALTSYAASGVVVGVRVHDGDYDEACAAMDGRTFTLDQAPPSLQHPNCTRALAPITDAAELARSA